MKEFPEVTLKKFNRAVKANRTNLVAWMHRGQHLCDMQLYSKAAEKYKKALTVIEFSLKD